MAKPKNAEDAVIVDDIPAAAMPELAIVPVKTYEVDGNFKAVEDYLKGVCAKYKDLAFTPETIDKAKIIKAELVSLRTSLTKIQTDVKKQRFNDPKRIFDAKMDGLLAITGEVEAEIDKALKAEDQKRIDELTEAFEAYKEHFVTVYSLEPEYADAIVFRQQYYNKTASEKDSKDDIELQCKTLAAEQKAYNGSVKLIRKALADTPEINVDEQIAKLKRGEDVASILEWIENEIERLAQVAAAKVDVAPHTSDDEDQEPEEQEEDSDAEDQESVEEQVTGIARKLDLKTDFPGKTKSLVIQITYPIDAGDALTKLFKELKNFGITTRVVKPEELVGGKLK
jgi:hypothetical protein